MTKRNKWTENEIEFLINNYELSGVTKTSEYLIYHTSKSVTKKAERLGLKVDKSIYSFNIDEVKETVKNSYCYADVLRKLKKVGSGDSYKVLNNYIRKNNIDVSHFEPYKNNKIVNKKYELKDLLINGSKIGSSKLKDKLYNENLKERKCEICGQNEIWNGNKMSLILDHINGVNDDNRLENLRIVCPNCNATLDTHCRGSKYLYKIKNDSKSEKEYREIIINPNKYNNEKKKKKRNENGFTDEQIKSILKQRRVERPSLDILKIEINELGLEGTGRKYGVTGNSIKKWIKTYNKLKI